MRSGQSLLVLRGGRRDSTHFDDPAFKSIAAAHARRLADLVPADERAAK